jgi:hypothetical protein
MQTWWALTRHLQPWPKTPKPEFNSPALAYASLTSYLAFEDTCRLVTMATKTEERLSGKKISRVT